MSPARYVQGKDAITRVGEFVAPIGKRPLLVADDVVWGIVEDAVRTSFADADLRVERVGFGPFATPQAIDDLVETIRATDTDVFVGLGGGSAIDAAKASGHLAGIRWASVPTAASTDAPTSALSVVYSDEGEFIEYRFFPHNPDLVLIDTKLVANAPVQFLVAGIGDALATWVEARAAKRAKRRHDGGRAADETGVALAELSWDATAHENALQAIESVKAKVVTPALEKVVEAKHPALRPRVRVRRARRRARDPQRPHRGAAGARPRPRQRSTSARSRSSCSRARRADEIEDFVVFTTEVGLPNTLTEIGLSVDDRDVLRAVAEAACAEGETIHNMPFPVTPEASSTPSSRSRASRGRIRAAHGLPEPEPYRAH